MTNNVSISKKDSQMAPREQMIAAMVEQMTGLTVWQTDRKSWTPAADTHRRYIEMLLDAVREVGGKVLMPTTFGELGDRGPYWDRTFKFSPDFPRLTENALVYVNVLDEQS